MGRVLGVSDWNGAYLGCVRLEWGVSWMCQTGMGRILDVSDWNRAYLECVRLEWGVSWMCQAEKSVVQVCQLTKSSRRKKDGESAETDPAPP